MAKPAEPVELPPLRLLLVDDSAAILDSMRLVLELDGHTVETAGGGKDGIEAFRAADRRGAPFDIVITDLGMPDVNGNDVARAVKAQSPATPVIMLTGWGRRFDTEKGAPAEVDRVLGKPPEIEDLRAALLDCIAKT
ncbi:MAG TPA: response regulator [Rhizomicrobium sp.]